MYIRLDCRMVPAGLLGGIRNCMRVFPNMNRSIFWLFRASWLSQKPKTPGFSHQNNWDLWGFIQCHPPKIRYPLVMTNIAMENHHAING